MASLTKPCVAATVARLVDRGVLQWGACLATWLPELSDTHAGTRSLEQLLSHRAGLQAHIVLNPAGLRPELTEQQWISRPSMLRRAAVAIREDCSKDSALDAPPVYSDLGYLLVGEAIARCSGEPLQRVVTREVLHPLSLNLGSADQLGQSLGVSQFTDRVAPTEHLGHRGGLVCGQVHDDNSWWLSGKQLSGHAGLFGEAHSVSRFAAAMVDAVRGGDTTWLSAGTAQVLVRPREGGSLRAGFDGKSSQGSSAGRRFGATSFGHLGFTGTSVWCEPTEGIVVALLTNRVYPSRENIEIRRIRPELHSALYDLAQRITS